LIDETQNITKEEIKTILTRAGENSKIVLTGDIEQIDDSRLDAMNNGLTYTIDKFKNSELAGHVSLREGVRSPLAAEAARLL
jgi:PhoH-like ATPase